MQTINVHDEKLENDADYREKQTEHQQLMEFEIRQSSEKAKHLWKEKKGSDSDEDFYNDDDDVEVEYVKD